MATVLVTGAAGFIGSHVTERLLGRGDTVIGLDNFDPFYPRALKERNLQPALSHAQFRFVEGDLKDAGTLTALFAEHRPERIIHLAAKAGVRPSIQNPAAYVEANVHGTVNLLTACERHPVEHFVFASSSSVYGDAARVPFSETDRTDEPASPYAATKKAGEVLLFTYHRLLRMPVTCLRFFTVIGPRQRPDLAINKFVRLIEAGEPIPFFGDGSTSRDYTYIDDTVDGILAALDHPSGYEIYNLGRSNPVSLTEMVRTIERVTGKTAIPDRQPDQPGDVRATYADVSKAAARLGYEPKVSFEEGIRRFVEWWQQAR
ncbi:MAG TPA: GDP-mannose 4,6-dehydratase [Armatimonadota bacterium]|nr:GDP-mannose 4,6-dehydratase [Armatimonadota bacterium]